MTQNNDCGFELKAIQITRTEVRTVSSNDTLGREGSQIRQNTVTYYLNGFLLHLLQKFCTEVYINMCDVIYE